LEGISGDWTGASEGVLMGFFAGVFFLILFGVAGACCVAVSAMFEIFVQNVFEICIPILYTLELSRRLYEGFSLKKDQS
jgi:hypothetical protein